MKRREFTGALAALVTGWPLGALAEERPRRVGVLMNVAESDRESAARKVAFAQALSDLGWTIDRDLQIDYRWYAGNSDTARKCAAELVALKPDVIVASGTLGVRALQQTDRAIPIVFTLITDPVGAGFVDSVAKPGGNITGFMLAEYSISAKWLDLLRQLLPTLKRVAVIREPSNPAASAQFGIVQAVGSSLGIQVSPISIRDAGEIEREIASFAGSPDGGLIVTGSAEATVHHDLIIRLANRHRLPAVYGDRFSVLGGALMSYGPDRVDQYRRAATYVHRILKGERSADLPVQAPTKYDLSINLKTAKAIGLAIPLSLLANADDVIE